MTEYVTLDGVFEEPGEWSFPFFSEDVGEFKQAELMASDVQLLGRSTYEAFAASWPTFEDEDGFAEKMNGMPKYVVSKTIKDPSWNNTTVINKNIADEVRTLKGQPGGSILVAGSGQLVRMLLNEGLVDEIRFMVHPLVLGGGNGCSTTTTGSARVCSS